jgi:integrase
VRSLRWRDLDFGKRLIHVRHSYVMRREDAPKSGRVRSVPMIDQVAAALDGLSRRAGWTGEEDLVFVNPSGEHIEDSALRRRFYAALEAAGLKHIRFHDLRHSFGTLAVQVLPLTDVKAYMGHADIATTMIYVHHVPQVDAAERLSAALRDASTAPPASAVAA